MHHIYQKCTKLPEMPKMSLERAYRVRDANGQPRRDGSQSRRLQHAGAERRTIALYRPRAARSHRPRSKRFPFGPSVVLRLVLRDLPGLRGDEPAGTIIYQKKHFAWAGGRLCKHFDTAGNYYGPSGASSSASHKGADFPCLGPPLPSPFARLHLQPRNAGQER